MKRLSTLLLAIIILLQFITVSGAYLYEDSSNRYTVQLPEDFKEVSSGKFIGNGNSTFNINITENKDKYCIANDSNKKLLEAAKEDAKAIESAFSSMGKIGGTEVISAKKIKHENGKTALLVTYNTYMEKDGKKVSHLQKTYTFSCEENMYSFVYTPQDDKDIDKLDSSFDSITISEPEIKSNATKIKEACIAAAFFLVIILGIIRFLRTPAKREKGGSR